MKKKNYIFVLLLCCFTMTTTAMNAESSVTPEEIDLSGNLQTDRQRTLIKPVQAFIFEQSIEVDFNAGLGTVNVSIYDESGNAVFQQSVMTYAGQVVYIDISSFDLGEYTLEFINSQEQYLYGTFVIE